jgi:hypothetical protein
MRGGALRSCYFNAHTTPDLFHFYNSYYESNVTFIRLHFNQLVNEIVQEHFNGI